MSTGAPVEEIHTHTCTMNGRKNFALQRILFKETPSKSFYEAPFRNRALHTLKIAFPFSRLGLFTAFLIPMKMV